MLQARKGTIHPTSPKDFWKILWDQIKAVVTFSKAQSLDI